MTPQAMPEAPEAMPVLSRTRTSLPLPRPLLRRFSARCQAELRPWMPAPMTTYLAWVGNAMKPPDLDFVAAQSATMPELGLDAATKHSDHKPSRFQTNFCKGTEMARIGAKGSSSAARGLPGLALATAPDSSAPQLRIVSDPMRGSSWITGQLRKAIHDGAYTHGEKLPAERQLAEAFGTSRTTVRMALDQLEQERLVTRRVGAGTFANYRGTAKDDDVTELTSPLELIEVRLALEPYMTR